MKKLTAGIFTALLGLVTVNAANAAIPSTSYVDTKITTAQEAAEDYADAQDALLKTAIETDYKAADTATLNSAKAYTDELKNGQVTTNANEIAGLKTSKQDALTAGSGIEIKTAEDGKLTIQTKGIATSESLDNLQTRMTTAEDDIDALQGDVQTLTNADATNLQAAKDYADGLATNYDAAGSAEAAEEAAKSYADGLAGNYDTKGSAAAAQVAAEAYADSLAGNYDASGAAAGALADAKAYADQAEADAVASAKSYADTEKVAKTGHTASQVVITDSTGAIATAAQIPNTQVSGLGGLATKSTIADADVATDAAIAQSKIAGLEDALANTTPKVTAKGEAGTYVLTAIVSDTGATSYQWEQIDRQTTGGEA